MIRVAFLNPTIPPRSISLFNKISELKKIELKAFFFAESQKNRSWDKSSSENEQIRFSYVLLNSKSIGFGIKDYINTFFSFDLLHELDIFKPDIIVLPGWADINSYLAFLWAKINLKKVILRTESTHNEKGLIRTMFLPLTKYICNNVDCIVSSSNSAKKYVRDISTNKNVVTIYSSFDTNKFADIVINLDKKSLKTKYGIAQRKVVYFNGQLIERKGIIPLIEAFGKVKLKNIALIITGDGQLKKQVKLAAENHRNIYYFGYQRQDSLPNFYKMADIFILPSYEETWGLVTIEAMAAGLPVIVSERAGSSELIDRYNGLLLKKVTATNIEKKILALLSLSKRSLNKMSLLNFKIATQILSYNIIAKKFVKLFLALGRI